MFIEILIEYDWYDNIIIHNQNKESADKTKIKQYYSRKNSEWLFS